MNYYIDFDNTLYNTPILTERMLRVISNEISEKKNLKEKAIYDECKAMFNREHIYDIFKLAKYFEEKYYLTDSALSAKISDTILNSNDLVFEDVIPFLKLLKKNENKIYMLTYCTDSLEYQNLKIAGSKIADYFDTLIITKEKKYTLDINYETGIFIDDSLSDLTGLYSKKPKKVIRVRRPGSKYSVKEIEEKNIIEFANLKDLAKSIDNE